MLQNCVPLDALRPGQHGTVAQLRLQGALLQRLLDLGLTEDCPISCRLRAPDDLQLVLKCMCCTDIREISPRSLNIGMIPSHARLFQTVEIFL